MEFSVGDILIGLGIGIALTLKIGTWYLERLGDMFEDEIDRKLDTYIGIDVEVDNGIILCYNSETRQFLCQGNTIADITTAFQEMFPHQTAYLNGGDPEIVTQWKMQIQIQNENSRNVRPTS